MYVHGFNQDPVEPIDSLTWLDYLIISHPQGVMKVLARYGYTGYLAPQDENEMYGACLDLMDSYGDQAVIDLLKSNPLYDTIADICKEETTINVPLRGRDGSVSCLVTTIKSINYVKLAENILLIIGTIYLADKLWKFMSKSN